MRLEVEQLFSKLRDIRILLIILLEITLSISLFSYNFSYAQTYDTMTKQRTIFKTPQIPVGSGNPSVPPIAVNKLENKIYVVNPDSNTVSVINSNTGNRTSKIPVGMGPQAIAINEAAHKIYVTNHDSDTVSVIDGDNDNEIGEIHVGKTPKYIISFYAVVVGDNPATRRSVVLDKIYVANLNSNTVSVLSASNNTDKIGEIPVGKLPTGMAVDEHGKIYVANSGSDSVSVLNAYNDKNEIGEIPVGKRPTSMAVDESGDKIYVANSGGETVSVLSTSNDKNKIGEIPVGNIPIDVVSYADKIYVANEGSSTVSVLSTSNDKNKIGEIPVGDAPYALAVNQLTKKIYVAKKNSNTVSVIDGDNDKNEIGEIPVGSGPTGIAVNKYGNAYPSIIYVLNVPTDINASSNTVSVIDGSIDKVATGVTFNVSPGNSGNIVCNTHKNPNVYNNTFPTNTYLYVESGTKCYAKPNKDFEFNSWIQNLDHNSTITLKTTEVSDSPWNSFLRLIGREPNDPSATFDVNSYGTFTANFKRLPPALPAEYWIPLYGIIVSSIVGWSIPSIIGAVKNTRQGRKSNQYYDRINHLYSDGKLDENDIADLDTLKTDITTASMKGKISEQHSANLKNEISVLYEKIYKNKIESSNSNLTSLDNLKNDINYAYSEGKINNEQYTNLKTEISILYEEIYKKRIDSLNDNKMLLDEVKNEIRDAFAKEKINEQHYKLLVEKLFDNKNNHGSANKLDSSSGLTSPTQGSPIKSK